MKIYIDNAILSDDSIAAAIEAKGIALTCTQDMNIECSENDYKALCDIIDPGDIHLVD